MFGVKDTSIEMENREYDTQEIFVEATKKLLDERGISQKALADAINVAPSELSGFMTLNKNYSEPKRSRIAEFFGMSYLQMLNMGQTLLGIPFSQQPDKEVKKEYRKTNIERAREGDESVLSDYKFLIEFYKEELADAKKAIERDFQERREIMRDYIKLKDSYMEEIQKSYRFEYENENLKKQISKLEARLSDLEKELVKNQKTA